jgi:hypothetical protein
VAAGEMNGLKMLGETVRQNLTRSDVVLIENYTDWFHGFPHLHRNGGGLGCDSNCYHRR